MQSLVCTVSVQTKVFREKALYSIKYCVEPNYFQIQLFQLLSPRPVRNIFVPADSSIHCTRPLLDQRLGSAMCSLLLLLLGRFGWSPVAPTVTLFVLFSFYSPLLLRSISSRYSVIVLCMNFVRIIYGVFEASIRSTNDFGKYTRSLQPPPFAAFYRFLLLPSYADYSSLKTHSIKNLASAGSKG